MRRDGMQAQVKKTDQGRGFPEEEPQKRPGIR